VLASKATIATAPLGGKEDVDRAVSAARAAFDDRKGWANWAAGKRGRTLAKCAALLKDHSEELAQLEVEIEASLTHLGRVVEGYWDREWRADHQGFGWHPEDHLWRAAHGYLDLMSGLASRLSLKGDE